MPEEVKEMNWRKRAKAIFRHHRKEAIQVYLTESLGADLTARWMKVGMPLMEWGDMESDREPDLGEENEVRLYGPLVSDPSMASFFGGVTAEMVIERMNEIEGDIHMRINSPGGDIMEMSAIVQRMQERMNAGDNVQCTIDGMAASAASVIAVKGGKVVIAEFGEMMIHEARMGIRGVASDLRKMADNLDSTNKTVAKAYAKRCGASEEDMREAMREETWYVGEEALDVGLVDEIYQVKEDAEDGEDETDEGEMTVAPIAHPDLHGQNFNSMFITNLFSGG